MLFGAAILVPPVLRVDTPQVLGCAAGSSLLHLSHMRRNIWIRRIAKPQLNCHHYLTVKRRDPDAPIRVALNDVR
jgi:hypothetical protein